ncbi:MAG: carbamoyltransferase [Candidatus Omnitrophica bacterium]|nr:carbamoyltransferase [Candidatus Omnitrophota bacterium]
MSVVLGVGPPCNHDPSAALLVDGRLIAAAEEERFTRLKHATDQLPLHSVRYCLQAAGLKPEDVEAVAYAWCPAACRRARWPYAARMSPTSLHAARKILTKSGKINQFKEQLVRETLIASGIDPRRVKISYVEHHIAHAVSSTLFSGFKDTAFMSVDGSGEFISMLLGEVRDGRLIKFKELYNPDSLGFFYSTITEYLGFRSNDGEYKVMGMAPYGDPNKADLSRMIRKTSDSFQVNNDYVWVIESKRHRSDLMYSRKMVEEFGPPRQGEGLSEPYIHIAAATQKIFEEIALSMVERYLAGPLKRHKTLCLAGGCALNVILNQRFLSNPLVERLFIQPAANDAGTSLGAAAYTAQEMGDAIEPMAHSYAGPGFEPDQIQAVLEKSGLPFKRCDDPVEEAAELLARGEILGWFQGRMEFGPRGLGNRSILGNPTLAGTSRKINTLVKFREPWRPFCPSILEEQAPEILGSAHPSPYMTIGFPVSPAWKKKIPEVVHVDGSARPQTVDSKRNPRFYALLKSFHRRSGVPALINTSLNRKGEPIVCTPEDAVKTFTGCGLRWIFIGDFLVSKPS